MATTVTVNDVLDGHVVLDVECMDRIYLNGYVPNQQVGGQAVSFMTAHLGYPIPSPAIIEKIGTTDAGLAGLSNGFATCSDPVGLQAICDRLGPGTIQVFAERWWSILPLPLTDA